MSRLRRNFGREFRDGAVRIVKETGRPVAHVARELGVNGGALGNWVRQDAAEQSGGLSADERAELVRLPRRVAEPGDGARCPQTIRNRLGERGHSMAAGMAGLADSQRTDHGVPHAVACRALGVAPSTFYKHLDRPPTKAQLRRQATDAEVKRAFDGSGGTCGSPRVRAQLRRDGMPVSKKTVEASMARQGLQARPKRKQGLTSQNPGAAAPSDLLKRDFSAKAVDQKWCGDFKEAKTAEGPVLPPHDRLRHLRSLSDRRAGQGRDQHGRRHQRRSPQRRDLPFRQGAAIHGQHLCRRLPAARNPALDRPHRQRFGQRPRRVVLLHPPTRTHLPAGLDDTLPGPARDRHVDQRPVQPAPTRLGHRNGPTGRKQTRPHHQPPQPTPPRLGGKLSQDFLLRNGSGLS